MIFIDTNVFMYAGGAPHSHKEPCKRLTVEVAAGEIDALIDAEVLQEILHRYRAINRWSEGRRVYDFTRRIVDNVVPVTAEIADQARRLLDRHQSLTARDAVHAAVCRAAEVDDICSYDRHFDQISFLRRREPNFYLRSS